MFDIFYYKKPSGNPKANIQYYLKAFNFPFSKIQNIRVVLKFVFIPHICSVHKYYPVILCSRTSIKISGMYNSQEQ